MAQQTLTPNDSEKDQYDVAQELYDREFNSIAKNYGASANSPQDNQSLDSAKQVANGEKQAIGDTAAGKAAIGAASTVASPVAGQVIKFLGKIKTKKGGIGTAIVGLFIAGALLIAGFMGPGLLIIQVKEALTDKFNDVTAAIEDRQTMIVKKRIGNATSGCTGIKITCRYKGMSDKQIQRLRAVGIEVETKGTKNIFGRTTIARLITPEKVEINARNYDRIMQTDLVARGHMNRGLSPKSVTYRSNAFNYMARKFGISKERKIVGDTKEDLDKSMRDSINGVDADGNEIGKTNVREENGKFFDENGNELTAEQADKINAGSAEFNRVTENIKNSGQKAVISAAKSGALVAATGGLAAVDSLCTGYYLIQAVGYGAKVIENRELIRFAHTIVNTGDVQKAGDATVNATNYIGNKMTQKNQYGESFTDSFGYKYAALNSLALPVEANQEATDVRRASIMQYAVGGGLGGVLLNFNQQLNLVTNNAPASVCGVVKNPFAQVGMLVGGVVLTVASGGSNLASGLLTSAAVSGTLAVVIGVAVPILQNIAAGEMVNEKDTIGGDAGNATVSGFGAMNAQNGAAHALKPLKKDQVLPYTLRAQEKTTLNKLAARAIADPLDVYDPASPAFTVASTLSTQVSAIKNNIITSPAAILGSSIQSLFGSSVSAASSPMAEYELCTDVDYVAKDYAADPFCNIRYGLSNEELTLDPEIVANWMYDNDHIDSDGRALSDEFTNYIGNCIDRLMPIGSTGPEGQSNDGSDCSKSDQIFQYFRVYYLDTIVNDDMDGEDTFGLNVAAASPTGNTPTNIGTPDDVVPKGKGFTLMEGKDYSGIPCADGTETLSTYTHPTADFTIQLCGINGIDVASIVSASVKQMIDAAAADGIRMTGGGFRSYEEQYAVRVKNCPDPVNSSAKACTPDTAKPGTSMHERGLALDLSWSGGNGFTWLVNNASRFNFYNLPSESWHWSTTGT